MGTVRKTYIAYLVRMWRVKETAAGEGIGAWRASLESPQTGKRIGFGSIEELFTYLRQEMESCEHKSVEEPG
jgi:hypothetical protein